VAFPATDAKKYIIVSDLHVPYQDKACVDAILDFARDIRPDGFIVNGDGLDVPELSRHAKGSVLELENLRIKDTFDAGNCFLDQVDAAVGPQCKERVWIEGNHCSRISRWIASEANAVFAGDPLLSVEGRLDFKRRGWKWIGEYPKAHYILGSHLVVTHGRWTGKYAAAVHCERYGRSVLVGHVHTPGAYYSSGFEKQRAGFVTGHLADVSSPAMSYAPLPNGWVHGFALAHVRKNGAYQVNLINFWDHVFYYGDKRYGKPVNRKAK